MKQKSIFFNNEQLNRLFPFYILIDNNLKVESFGKDIGEHCSIKKQKLFTRLFALKNPELKNIAFEDLKTLTGQTITLESTCEKRATLFGQFEYMSDQDCLIFVGTPKLNSIGDLNSKKFKTIVENASEIIYEINSQGYFTYANPVFYSLFGYSFEELIKKQYWDLVKESHKEEVKYFYYNQLNQKIDESYLEFPAIAKNGDIIWIGQNVNIRFKPDGTLDDIITVGRNVTERIEIEESILRKQKMLKGITMATEELFTNPSLTTAINNSLSILGEAVNVTRTYIFAKSVSNDDNLIATQLYEWVAEGGVDQILSDNSHNISLSIFGDFLSQLYNKEPFEAIVSQLDDTFKLKEVLISQHVKSILIIPVFQRDKFWGFIGYDDCATEKKWLQDELLLLKSFGNSLTSALEITDTTQQLKYTALFYLENPDPIVRINLRGEVILINKPGKVLQHAKILGSNKDIQAIYKDLSEKLNAENRIEIFEIKAEKQYYSATARLSESNAYINIYFSDITKQKEGEKAIIKSNRQLKRQEEKYRNIISNMNLGLLEVDNNDVIQFCNQGFTEISGFDLSEIIEKKASEIIFVNNNVQGKNLIQAFSEPDSFEILTKNKIGEARWWLISHAPNFNDKGEKIGSIRICLDISQKKILEVELKKSLIESQKASKSKELFLANMSHEIRTPLNGIIGMIRELNKVKNPSTTQSSYLNSAMKASRHLLSVVDNILEITKIESGELSLTPHHFSIQELLNDISSILKPQAKQNGVEFVININKNVSEAFIADESRIRQILINLAGNGIKFTENGKVTIDCISLEESFGKQELNFIVRDTGIGMDEKYLTNIFKKFQQEDSSTSRKHGGSGLGLFITKQLVDLMQGTLKINSIKGKGTVVQVCLPLSIGILSEVPQKQIFETKNVLYNAKVLLVEDHEINRMVAINTLKLLNVELTEAENGLEAVKLLKKETYDLIFMDVQMPIMSGIEATKIIRGDLKIQTPIVALSANAFKSEIDACLAIGMNDYVTKPFEEEHLLSMVSKYCKTSKKLNAQTLINTPQNISIRALYDLKKLNEMSRGDHDFVIKMVNIFIDTTPTYLKQINSFYKEMDIISINKIAHKMKPSIEIMGITILRQDIRALEQYTLGNNVDNTLKILIDKVINVLSEVVSQLKENELSGTKSLR